jgi:phosphomannomutase
VRVDQLQEIRRRTPADSLFDEEGAGGVFLNDLRPDTVRRLATALGVHLRRACASAVEDPTVIIAGDGRPLTGELVAAGSEGLRFAGCKVIDIGAATSPCLVFAMDHLPATGGLMVGNPRGLPQHVGLKFWGEGALPFSAGHTLDALQDLVASGVDRPVRRYGQLRRFNAEVPYLACLHKYFHALRPLRVVLDTASEPLARYVSQLATSVACEIVTMGRQPTATSSMESCLQRLGQRVQEAESHFGMWIDGDGETCRIIDELGHEVDPQHLLLVLFEYFLAEHPQAELVLEENCHPQFVALLQTAGARVHRSCAVREAMADRLRTTGALAGGGPSGRVWFHDHRPAADALKMLTLLLNILSQSDRDFSEVLAIARTTCAA